MKTMLLAFIAVGVIALGAHYALDSAAFSAADRTRSSNVRLD